MMVSDWGATHVLAHEEGGKMVETLVRKEKNALLTRDEWASGAVPDWTFEDDGRLYWCGEDFAATRGTCTLRPVGQPRLSLDAVLAVVRGGLGEPFEMSRLLRRSVEEIETSLATLERLGRVEVSDGDGYRIAGG